VFLGRLQVARRAAITKSTVNGITQWRVAGLEPLEPEQATML
jgi:hypothetical protein